MLFLTKTIFVLHYVLLRLNIVLLYFAEIY